MKPRTFSIYARKGDRAEHVPVLAKDYKGALALLRDSGWEPYLECVSAGCTNEVAPPSNYVCKRHEK